MHGEIHKSNNFYSPKLLLTQNLAEEQQTSILRCIPALVKEGLFMIEMYDWDSCLKCMFIVLCLRFTFDVDACSWCLMFVFAVDVWAASAPCFCCLNLMFWCLCLRLMFAAIVWFAVCFWSLCWKCIVEAYIK